MLSVVVVDRLAFDNVALLHRKRGRAEHAHLLGLGVVDRRLSRERVEVIVGERFLRHRGGRGPNLFPQGVPVHQHVQLLLDAIEVAGHELQRGVAERRPAAVSNGDPAVEVGSFVITRDSQHVVGVPRELTRQIRSFDAMTTRAFVVERPDQSWT